MKAAIVGRVSTTKEEQEASLLHQRQFFENYVSEKGWDVYDFYEETESGTKFNRKEMNRLIRDAKAKKFDIILSKELSRLARNQRLALEIKDIIEKHGIHLITMDGAVNTTTGNINMFGLFAWIYEQEAQRTSERIKMAFTIKAKNGHFKGSNPPYGYKLKDGKLFISEDGTADTVRRIYKMYLDGNGFDAIARVLFNEGVPTPSQIANKRKQSAFWNGSSVRLILENPNYTGDLVQNRSSTMSVTIKERRVNPKEQYIIVKNTHDAIIPRDVFETVQNLIVSRRKKSVDNPEVNSKPHENVHLFTGVIYCADCGSAFHYKKNRRGYICGRYNKHGSKACSDHHVLENSLKGIIQGDLQKLGNAIMDEKYFSEVKVKLKKQQARLEKDLKTCSAKLEAITQLKNKALTRYLQEEITKMDYDNYIRSQDNELKTILFYKEKLESELSTSLDSDVLGKIKGVVDDALGFKDITREVVNRFIEKIEVESVGTIKLFYRFTGSSQLLNELLR